MSLRSFLAAAGTAVAAVAATVTIAGPASAAASSYVALGDSYSSGVGTRTYINDGTGCQRSVYAYPSLIAAARGYALNFRACSGAKVPDVRNNQLGALNSGTRYVSISVGGNDAGFASVLTECALPGWMSNCNRAIDRAQSIINGTLPSSLAGLYSSIRSRAAAAKVVVVGYPRLFNGEDCNAGTWFSPSEESRLNATADLLNSRTATAAAGAGFTFVNPTSVFIGHAVCGNPEWLNGLSWPISDSFHPNRTGHSAGYTPLVSPRLTGTAVRVDTSVMATAAAAQSKLTAQQQTYAARDASIRPQVFVKPDLSTPQAKVAAAKAGVNLASRASIDAADAVWSNAQSKASGYLEQGRQLAGQVKDGAVSAGQQAASTVRSWGAQVWGAFGG